MELNRTQHETIDERGLSDLAVEVRSLIRRVEAVETQFEPLIKAVDERYRESARNLVHYVAVRSGDLRRLQGDLAQWGLSSLGRMEAHAMDTLTAVSSVLDRLVEPEAPALDPVEFPAWRELIDQRTMDLFGTQPDGRHTRIMVTLPSDADADVVRSLVEAGTDCIRINCAKDDEATWERMVRDVRAAEVAIGRSCRILMDLAAAKPRTGPLEPGPAVARWKPSRDVWGKVKTPVLVAMIVEGTRPAVEADATVFVDADWLGQVAVGDRLTLRDAREKKRQLDVVARFDGGILAAAEKTIYVTNGTKLKVKGGKATRLRGIPATEKPIVVVKGDRLVLDADEAPGRLALRDGPGAGVVPARVGCTTPSVFDEVKVGEPVKFDDGKIEGVIESVSADEVVVRITLAQEKGSKLRADKGINFPGSDLRPRGLTDKDRRDLDFVIRHADLVGLSFVEGEETVRLVQEALAEHGARHVGIMLKIETQRGFRRLPRLLLEAMRTYPVGVMIARGDLAVECGWARTAEAQEEILWICEAAHVPVVWATQVLESLTKKGIPSRAEITDAAMAERAECVMLNKGPYILDAIRSLDDVLRRMGGHQVKKTPLMRQLRVTDVMLGEGEATS